MLDSAINPNPALKNRADLRAELFWIEGACRVRSGLPLPGGERVGVRGIGLSIVRNPSPGSPRDPISPYARGEGARSYWAFALAFCLVFLTADAGATRGAGSAVCGAASLKGIARSVAVGARTCCSNCRNLAMFC